MHLPELEGEGPMIPTPFDAAGRAREIVEEWQELCAERQPSPMRGYALLIDLLAAALTAVRDEERERAAKIAEAQAYVEECADDTMAGVTRGRPFRNLAAAIRYQEKP